MGRLFSIFPGRLFAAVFLLAACICPVHAEDHSNKIVVIQLKKVYEGYWKYRQVKELLDSKRDQLEAAEQDLDQTAEQAMDRLKQLQMEASSPALSQAARTEKAQEATEIRQKLQMLDAERKQKRRALVQFGQSERNHLLSEIMALLRDYSEKHGYDLVLDNSASAKQMPAPILYAKEEMDITQRFMDEINKGHEMIDDGQAEDEETADPAGGDAETQSD